MLLILLIAAGTILETLFIMELAKRAVCAASSLRRWHRSASCCSVCSASASAVQSEHAVLVFCGDLCAVCSGTCCSRAALPLAEAARPVSDCRNAGVLRWTHSLYSLAILNLSPAAGTRHSRVADRTRRGEEASIRMQQGKRRKILPLGVVYIGTVLFMASCALSGRASDLQPRCSCFSSAGFASPERDKHAGRTGSFGKMTTSTGMRSCMSFTTWRRPLPSASSFIRSERPKND